MAPPSAAAESDPRVVYGRHLESRRASVADAVRRHTTFGNLRIAALATTLLAAYATFAHGVFPWWWTLAPAAAFFWAGWPLERAVSERARLARAVTFYERALARLDGRWAGTGGETGDRFLDDAHLYARDLDLFGEASLFELLTCARTRIGEETLAAWLKGPAEPPVVRARQEAVAELAPRATLREDLAVLGEHARERVHAEGLSAWGEGAAELDSPTVPVWLWPLTAAGALAGLGLLSWIAEYFGVIRLGTNARTASDAFVPMLCVACGTVVWRFHKQCAAIFRGVSAAADDLRLLAGVVGRLEAERFSAARLSALRRDLDVEGQPVSRRIARLNALTNLVDSRDHLFVRLLGPLVLWDLHLAYAIERWRRTSGPSVRHWLAAIGEMEALSSLAGYCFEHPNDVFPDLCAGPPCFVGEGLGHPLISGAVTVLNDVSLGGDLRVLVVSGSNMSGKSTLLRTVGVNAVLAQAGAPVRARRLRLAPLEIGASIRIQDSLQAGVSRFYAEITRLSLIMRRAGEAPHVLFLLDELLHGTNSHDRRIGAEAIVRGLIARGAIGFVTTHDLALARVADALGARGANVHFEDVVEDGRMRFDYLMRPGVVQNSNALALMRAVGLDVLEQDQ